MSLSDQGYLNGEYLELNEGISHSAGIEAPPTAIVTDIEGGLPYEIRDMAPAELGVTQDESIQGPAIMKTVVIEQSCKQV